ncbi:MAG: ribosomal protein S18-alanine N-acetyltransferase [Pseudomonadota bacterium]
MANPTTELTLSKAGPQSAALLAAIHADAFERGWQEDEFFKLLSLPTCQGALAAQGTIPVGFILTQQVMESAEILTLAVEPAYRRRGVAGQLVREAERQTRAAGARRMMLEVSRRNAAALALYDAAGYAEAGLRKAYYPDGADALILAKSL